MAEGQEAARGGEGAHTDFTTSPEKGTLNKQSPDAGRATNLHAGGDAAEDGPQESAQAETCTQDREGSQGAEAPQSSTMPIQGAANAGDIQITSKSDLRALLRRAGLSRAAAEKVASGGWPALAGPQDGLGGGELDRAAAELRELNNILREIGND